MENIVGPGIVSFRFMYVSSFDKNVKCEVGGGGSTLVTSSSAADDMDLKPQYCGDFVAERADGQYVRLHPSASGRRKHGTPVFGDNLNKWRLGQAPRMHRYGTGDAGDIPTVERQPEGFYGFSPKDQMDARTAKEYALRQVLLWEAQ